MLLIFYGFVCIRQKASRAETPQDQTLRAMFQMGLVESAKRYAATELALTTDEQLKAWWTMRLAESHALAALYDRENQIREWTEAAQILDDFAQANVEHTRIPWLNWQKARIELLRAQSSLADFLSAPGNDSARQSSLLHVRGVIDLCDQLVLDLEKRLPLAARETLGGQTQAPAEQLHQLRLDTQLLRCEAVLIRLRLYPPKHRDRVAAATDVNSIVLTSLQDASAGWPERDTLLVAQATAGLELSERSKSLIELERLAMQGNSTATRIRAAATAIEALIEDHESTRAHNLLELLRGLEAGPELHLAELRLGVTELSSHSTEKDRQLNELVARLNQLGTNYGSYWRSRGEAILVSANVAPSSGQPNANRDLALAQVRQLLAAGNENEAIARLLQYRDNDAAVGRPESALTFASQACVLLRKQSQWLAAVEAVDRTALQFSSSVGAAQAHYLAILSLSDALRAQPTQDDLQTRYEEALIQQLSLWPDAAETDATQVWLEKWLAGQARFTRLAEALRKRALASRQPTIVDKLVVQWLGVVLNKLDDVEQQSEISQIQLIEAPDQQIQATYHVAALAATVLSTWTTEDESLDIAQQISKLPPATALTESLRSSVMKVLEARRISVSGRADMQNGVSARDLPSELVGVFAQVLLEAVDNLPPAEHQSRCQQFFSESQNWADVLSKESSTMYQALGHRLGVLFNEPKSFDQMRALTNRYPRDGRLSILLSTALVDAYAITATKEYLDEALAISKRVAVGSEPGSDLHWSARWRTLQIMALQGRTSDAAIGAKLLLNASNQLPEPWRGRIERLSRL